MSKQGILHCFINYKFVQYEGVDIITKSSTFHFSGKASEERQIKAIGAVCSGLLQHIGIEHDVNFCYKPMYEKNCYYMAEDEEKKQ